MLRRPDGREIEALGGGRDLSNEVRPRQIADANGKKTDLHVVYSPLDVVRVFPRPPQCWFPSGSFTRHRASETGEASMSTVSPCEVQFQPRPRPVHCG